MDDGTVVVWDAKFKDWSVATHDLYGWHFTYSRGAAATSTFLNLSGELDQLKHGSVPDIWSPAPAPSGTLLVSDEPDRRRLDFSSNGKRIVLPHADLGAVDEVLKRTLGEGWTHSLPVKATDTDQWTKWLQSLRPGITPLGFSSQPNKKSLKFAWVVVSVVSVDAWNQQIRSELGLRELQVNTAPPVPVPATGENEHRNVSPEVWLGGFLLLLMGVGIGATVALGPRMQSLLPRRLRNPRLHPSGQERDLAIEGALARVVIEACAETKRYSIGDPRLVKARDSALDFAVDQLKLTFARMGASKELLQAWVGEQRTALLQDLQVRDEEQLRQAVSLADRLREKFTELKAATQELTGERVTDPEHWLAAISAVIRQAVGDRRQITELETKAETNADRAAKYESVQARLVNCEGELHTAQIQASELEKELQKARTEHDRARSELLQSDTVLQELRELAPLADELASAKRQFFSDCQHKVSIAASLAFLLDHALLGLFLAKAERNTQREQVYAGNLRRLCQAAARYDAFKALHRVGLLQAAKPTQTGPDRSSPDSQFFSELLTVLRQEAYIDSAYEFDSANLSKPPIRGG
jgi:hypothetical protein